MGGPTYWEVHEYDRAGSPALAFVAGAGGHAAADEFGTTFYVEREEGWRDGASMRDSSVERLLNDGSWTGPQLKQSFLVILSGIFIAKSQEGMFSSMRRARNVLGRDKRTGRLLAQDSDGRRLYADVVRGGSVNMDPTSPKTGQWSMSFLVNDPIYYSEEYTSVTLGVGSVNVTGHGFPHGFPMAFQAGNKPAGAQRIRNGGDVPTHFTATIKGPCSGFTLTDGSTGRSLACTASVPLGSDAVLDTQTKTFLLDGQNARWALSGSWFLIPPGEAQFTFLPLGANSMTSCTIRHSTEAWGG